jgi:hypothetical protein
MKKIKIGRTYSPSTIISTETIEDCTAVLFSYGGGMGGANETYYCTKVDREKGSEFLTLTLYNGEVIQLNLKNVVTLRKFTLFIVVANALAWSNYHKTKYNRYIVTEYYRIGFDEEVEFLPNSSNVSENIEKNLIKRVNDIVEI